MEKQVPYTFAKKNGVFIENANGTSRILYKEGVSTDVMQEACRYLGWDIPHKLVSTNEFEDLLQKNYTQAERSAASQISSQMLEDDKVNFTDINAFLEEPDDLLSSDDDAPIIKLLNAILFEAIRENASDIHIEPYLYDLIIRFRLDGVLKSTLKTQVKIASFLVTRIKVLARLDIAEKRVPQDGRLSVRLGGKDIDMRVSTMPSAYGERVVLRLLDKEETNLDLTRLGMDDSNRKKLERLIQKPHGILLVTGPTGSGKTTTLYSCLQKLNNQTLNIMTIEDPIEYYFNGISQTQVNIRPNMTFARGLRAILRQDPDVVLVGEIRDAETARIGVQASLTGHLVLSTLHTNTAIGAITRLRDMELETFLLASTLQGVMAQRLLRRLCSECKEAYEPNTNELKILNLKGAKHIYKPKGCDKCYNTGYQGRIAIYELVEIDATLRRMINEDASESDMGTYAHTQTQSIKESAYHLVREGTTSYVEAVRVIQD